MPDLPATMFHFADAANESSIREHGLLSTAQLLQRQAVDAQTAASAMAFRPHDLDLPGGQRIRNQSPMPPAVLARCLDDGTSPEDWYRLVNGHVFFWLSTERMRRHGRALCTRAQILYTIDARALVAVYGDAAFVTPFNVGNALRMPARRGARTLCPLASWREDGWKHETPAGGHRRSRHHPPAELLVRGAVPDIHTFILESEFIAPW